MDLSLSTFILKNNRCLFCPCRNTQEKMIQICSWKNARRLYKELKPKNDVFNFPYRVFWIRTRFLKKCKINNVPPVENCNKFKNCLDWYFSICIIVIFKHKNKKLNLFHVIVFCEVIVIMVLNFLLHFFIWPDIVLCNGSCPKRE